MRNKPTARSGTSEAHLCGMGRWIPVEQGEPVLPFAASGDLENLMKTPVSRSALLAALAGALGVFLGGAALAAWPDSYQHRVANMTALYWDLGFPGVGQDAKRTKALYSKSCNIKKGSACSYKAWQDGEGGSLEKAAGYYGKKCPSDPQSCVVMGWVNSKDAQGNLVDTASASKGYNYHKRACDKAYAPGCSGMAEMHIAGVGAAQNYGLARRYASEGCKAQDYWGCYLEGTIYERGLGVGVDMNKATLLFRKACRKNVPHACIKIAEMSERGLVQGGSAEKAAATYGKYCKEKVFAGCGNLGRLYMEGRGVDRNVDTALALYKQSCDAGDLNGCFGMAKAYESGRSSEGGPEEAASIYEKVCNTGNADACVRLGKLYLRGRGVPKDPEVGIGFVTRACDGGNLDGCDVLGQLYESGNGVKMDVGRAVQKYSAACDGGVGRGCYHLAKLYQVGKGVSQDSAKAGDLFESACAGGHGKSCGLLARAYLTGDGVRADSAKAADLYEKGCQGGHGESCAKVGGMYQNGSGVSADISRAMAFYQDACGLESAVGCFTLARAYETGNGVDKNFKRAVTAYKDACNYGYEQACDAGGKIAFQASFTEIMETRWENQICELWSFDPDRPNKTEVVAYVKGDTFDVKDGPRSGQSIQVELLGDTFQTGKIFKGASLWKGPGGKKVANIEFSHYETWNSVEDPIDAFPADEAYSDDRMGDTRLIYSRGEEQVRRNLASKQCKFGSGYPLITTEHCTAIQALVGAQLLTSCKGE